MPNPAPSWSTVPVFGTYRHPFTGQPDTGHLTFSLARRIVNATDKVIFPAGDSLTVELDTVTGRVYADLPALDDPDNFPADDTVQYQVVETLAGGVGLTYWIRPVLAMLPAGLDLRTIVIPSTVTVPSPYSLVRGVAGGVAALNAAGQVVDATGTPVTGGGGGSGGGKVANVEQNADGTIPRRDSVTTDSTVRVFILTQPGRVVYGANDGANYLRANRAAGIPGDVEINVNDIPG